MSIGLLHRKKNGKQCRKCSGHKEENGDENWLQEERMWIERWRERKVKGRRSPAAVSLTKGVWPLPYPIRGCGRSGLGVTDWVSWECTWLCPKALTPWPCRVILYLGLLGNIILEGKGRGWVEEAIRKGKFNGILRNSGFPVLQWKFRQGPLTFVLSKTRCVTHTCHLQQKEFNGQSLQVAFWELKKV